MKTKEFLSKYNLKKGWDNAKGGKFIADMTSEFTQIVETSNAKEDIRAFNNAVKIIRTKWNAISNKIPYGIPPKVWAYFYATVVAKTRDTLFPMEAAQ